MPQPRAFVVHHHTAAPAGDHYDLMFDIGDALATWRSAVALADIASEIEIERIGDHRRAYLTLAGPLSGGRGSVSPVETGTYEAITQDADHWEIAIITAAGTRRLELRHVAGPVWRIRPL